MPKKKKYQVNIVNIPMDVPRQPAPARKIIGVTKKPVAGHAASIVAKLPLMRLSATVGVWRNAIGALKDPKRKHLIPTALSMNL